LLGPAIALGYARAYAGTYCSQTPSGTVSSSTSFDCAVAAGTMDRPLVFYTGYGMWYSGENHISRGGLPLTITNDADIDVSGTFATGSSNSGAQNYTPAFPASSKSGSAIQINSLSGGLLAFNIGNDAEYSGNDVAGGAGAPITISSNGSVTAPGFGIAAYSTGGHGSKAGTTSGTAGDGGASGAVVITVNDNVFAGTGPAVLGASYGGGGGRTGKLGHGGAAGDVALTFGQNARYVTSGASGALFTGSPIVSGSAASAISYGGDAYRDNGGNAGAATISAAATEGLTFSTAGTYAPALFARSYGGTGNGQGYTGGSAAEAGVELSGQGTIATTGARAPGIVAQSLGGAGQSKKVTDTKETSATGGVAGEAYAENSFTITTSGTQSHGIVVQSAGAGGGIFRYTGSGQLTWGDQNVSSGKGAAVDVSNSGAITTTGSDANGIVAQSIGGGGGHVDLGPDAGAVTVGGLASNVSGNSVTVSNSGDISTLGGGTATSTYGGGIAIVAQSIGGGGGTMAGGSGRIGGAGTGSTGGEVSVTNRGASLSTAGTDAHGILAQSIGGGGGQGRNSTGLFVAVGGTGGAGGNAGEATVNNSGAITVSGDYANGMIVQSIGGGGGTGGHATAIGAFGLPADAHGGSGGAGGVGSDATANNAVNGTTGSIVTQGLNSTAMMAQSIGGGGGSGGAAKSVSAGVFSVSLAFGGSGSGGGDGGAAIVNAAGNLTTYNYDSVAVVSQSVGGGGGQGGVASAKSFGFGMPVDAEGNTVSAAVSIAHGGSGGAASDGGAASATNYDSTSHVIEQAVQTSSNQTDPTTGAVSLVTVQKGTAFAGITTFGDNSTGMLVQSIGGGGGAGGDATANSSAGVLQKQLDDLSDGEAPKSIDVTVDVALGGTAGGGGAGGTATATNKGSITTFGLFADGIVVQSIGGGGGQGGSGNSKSKASGDTSFGLNVSLGATGGAGGSGGAASAGNDANATIVTNGDNSRGILTQSIGGGGGNGGGGGGSTSASFGLSIGLGASGATGGSGGAATAWNYGTVRTEGDWSDGVMAQSIGGGGGNGGAGDSSLSVTSSEKFSDIFTPDSDSSETDDGASDDDSTTGSFALSLGTTGGGGGDAGAVVVGANVSASAIPTDAAWTPKSTTTSSTIVTAGNNSNGLVAQSIGGGGGNAAISPASSSVNATLNIGASGGGGGAGGEVFVIAGNITTSGFSSHGVLAQSIGGGGGTGVASGVATTIKTRLGSENVALETGAHAGSSNDGGAVSVTTQDDTAIVTGREVRVAGTGTSATDAFGILAQSIGGGGGTASAAMGSATASSGQGAEASHSITLGGGPVASETFVNGGDVSVFHQGDISTYGARGFGIVAQSIGGGGGLVSGDANSLAGVKFAKDAAGFGGNVTVGLLNAPSGESSYGAMIETFSDGAFGILTQSIGGGGVSPPIRPSP
jgi:hypothetical protein